MIQKRIKNKAYAQLIIIIFVSSILFGTLLLNPKLPYAKAGSTWIQTSDKDFEDGEFNNITMIGDGKNTDLIINMTQRNIWTKMNLSSYPRKMCQHAMASIYGTNKVLLFGGLSGITLNQTWTYDIITHTWTQKIPKASPSHRHYHAMASVYGDDKVVLFGGSYSGDEGGGQNRNDTWVYDLSENNWTKKKPINYPSKRQRHAMVSIFGDDKVLLFGGTNGYRNYDRNDTWVYDLSDNTWTEKKPIFPPFVRDSHAMASIDGEDKVVLFGGRLYSNTGTEYYKDTWIYDLSDNTWTNKNQSTSPPHRCNSAMATIYETDRVVMFGGFFRDWHLSDTWIYDLSQNKWITEMWLLGPSPRWMHAMAPVHGTDKVVLFGGNPDEIIVGRILNDTWIYQHFSDKKNGTYISIPYDTGSNSSFSRINWSAVTSVDSSITIQLRSAANKSLLATQPFVGPEGSSYEFYNESKTEIWSGHTGDRWIQYKIYFNLDRFTESPTLENITITYNCLPITIPLSPSNGSISTTSTPKFIWTYTDVDSFHQQAFQVLIADNINFTNISYDSGVQIKSDEWWMFPAGTNYTELPDGNWYWKARTMDEDGEWSKFSTVSIFKVDTNAPTSAPVTPINNGSYISLPTVSGIATESSEGSGIQKVEVTIKRLSDNYYWNNINWVPLSTWLSATGTTDWVYDSSNVTWESGINYYVQSRAWDLGGNIELPNSANVFIIDRLPPASNIESPIDEAWLNVLSTISGSSFDIHGSGVANVEISIKCIKNDNTRAGEANINDFWAGDKDKWKSAEAWLPALGTEQWSYNSSSIQWSTGNRYLIRSRAIDNAGNLESPGSGIVFNYDNSPPEQLSIQINNGEEFTQTTEVNLTLHAVDVGSGCTQMVFSIDGLNWSNWEPFAAEKAFTLTTNDGVKTVYFKVMDRAGNIAEPVYDTIILDTTPPQNLSVVINENAIYTNSNRVTLSLAAQDLGSGINEMSFSNNGMTWTGWLPFSSETIFNLTPRDGEKRIRFRVSDKVGNIAEPISDSIILDGTPPHSLSIFINGGAAETNSTIITLSLLALDNLSGMYQMSFSTDGINWGEWEKYLGKRAYDLPQGDGNKIIYFRVMDNAGNTATPVGATIVLNTTADLVHEQPPEVSSTGFGYWLFLIGLIIILILVFFMGLVIHKKRQKQIKQKLLLPDSGTAETPEQIPTATTPPILPGNTSATTIEQPTIATTPIPTLAKSTQIPLLSTAQETAVAQELPALPSGTNQQNTSNSPASTSKPSENDP
ncbi:Kelch repeat-containing protein [[Eubacterium] cellulosolvens]